MTHGSEKRARTAHLTIRLTTDERATIDAAAERGGLTAGSYARQTLLVAPVPRQVRRPPVERQLMVRLLGELGRIGNNINQIARAVNAGDQVDPAKLGRAFAALILMRDAVLMSLGRAP